MTDQNSEIDYQIRPDSFMEELGIKKDAYYAYIKFLDIKVEKADGKAYLTTEQADLLRSLRSHVLQHGKMEGFVNTNSGELTIAESSSSIDQATPQVQEIPIESDDHQFDDLIRAAAELKGQRLVMPQMVINELANRMTYEDLPDDVRAKVDAVKETTSPKQPSQLAEQILSRWRNQSTQANALRHEVIA